MYKELRATILCHDTRHSYCNKNKTVGSKLCRDIIKVCHNRIKEKAQRIGSDRKLLAATKNEDSVTTKFSMS